MRGNRPLRSLIQFENPPRLFQVDLLAVHRELIFTSILRHPVNVRNRMSLAAKLLHKKFDVCHTL